MIDWNLLNKIRTMRSIKMKPPNSDIKELVRQLGHLHFDSKKDLEYFVSDSL